MAKEQEEPEELGMHESLPGGGPSSEEVRKGLYDPKGVENQIEFNVFGLGEDEDEEETPDLDGDLMEFPSHMNEEQFGPHGRPSMVLPRHPKRNTPGNLPKKPSRPYGYPINNKPRHPGKNPPKTPEPPTEGDN